MGGSKGTPLRSGSSSSTIRKKVVTAKPCPHHRLEQRDKIALEGDIGFNAQVLGQRLHMLPVVKTTAKQRQLLSKELREGDGRCATQGVIVPHHHQHLFAQQMRSLDGGGADHW